MEPLAKAAVRRATATRVEASRAVAAGLPWTRPLWARASPRHAVARLLMKGGAGDLVVAAPGTRKRAVESQALGYQVCSLDLNE